METQNLATEITRQLCHLLEQSLIKIDHCLDQLTDEQVWLRPAGSGNSIGNLVLHLNGNLRQWGIVPLLGMPDQRDRESEFTHDQVIARSQLVTLLHATVDEAQEIWNCRSEQQLLSHHTIQGFNVSETEALVHTSSHFVGHTHQIIQLTRQVLGANYRFHWTPESDRGDLPV